MTDSLLEFLLHIFYDASFDPIIMLTLHIKYGLYRRYYEQELIDFVSEEERL